MLSNRGPRDTKPSPEDRNFALIALGEYGKDVSVLVQHKSDRPEKQRAETLTLLKGVADFAIRQGIAFELINGALVIRG